MENFITVQQKLVDRVSNKCFGTTITVEELQQCRERASDRALHESKTREPTEPEAIINMPIIIKRF